MCIGFSDFTLPSLLNAAAAMRTVSGRDIVHRPTHDLVLNWTARISLSLLQYSVNQLQDLGGPRPAAPAARPRLADPVGSCGRRCVAEHCGPEPGMRSRRWRSDAVGPPGPVRPLHVPNQSESSLHSTDIGVGMSSQRESTAEPKQVGVYRRSGLGPAPSGLETCRNHGMPIVPSLPSSPFQ